jgi:acetyltransferase-like isoleucine patch superfamily enzyme
MTISLTAKLIETLRVKGISTLQNPGSTLPDKSIFEPPLSLKWMAIQHSIEIGAFSYAVSGYYFGCRIGRYCSFGEEVQIGRHPHPMHWFSTSPLFYSPAENVFDRAIVKDSLQLKPIDAYLRSSPPVTAKLTVIGNDVWIGHGAFILPGVSIGNGAVVAAMSVVTKDVPPYSVVAGSPAKIIRYRFAEARIKRLLNSAWWQFAPWQLKGAPVDKFPDFFDFISELRKGGELPYKPDKVVLSELIVE